MMKADRRRNRLEGVARVSIRYAAYEKYHGNRHFSTNAQTKLFNY